MALIGIDLGTTNSLVTAYLDGKIISVPNALGQEMTRSAISILNDGTAVVGERATQRLISHPDSTAASFKQFMGTDHTLSVGGRDWTAHELSSILLKQLKMDGERFLGEPVDEAIISVPAYFNDNQRSATKLAASLAGIKANRLINEPSAAALYHRHQTGVQEGKLLVIDFGGGTLDVSVVECFDEMVEILAISGDNHLGGQDIDHMIVQYFYQEVGIKEDNLSLQQKASLTRSAEMAKITLTHTNLTLLGLGENLISLDNEILAELCAPLFARVRGVIVQAVQLSKISISEITDVVLVGGSAKLSVFSDFLKEVFGLRPVALQEADYMVSRGLGLCCGIKNREIPDLFMTDVCPFSLGIGVHNRTNADRPLMSVLISRCSVLPSSMSRTFYTIYDGQNKVECTICQGENMYEDENLKLSTLSLRVLPAPAGQSRVQVTFTYTIDGILQVKAKADGGDKAEVLIVNPSLDLSAEELEEQLQHLEQVMTLQSMGGDADNLLFATLERLYCETLDDDREDVTRLYQELESSIHRGNPSTHYRTQKSIRQSIIELEQKLNPSLQMDIMEDL